jgi:hypothetical protein
MTNQDPNSCTRIVGKHRLARHYFGRYDFAVLGYRLRGEPDTPEWRGIFEKEQETPVPYKGRIIAKPALMDYFKLRRIDLGIDQKIQAACRDMYVVSLPRFEDVKEYLVSNMPKQ